MIRTHSPAARSGMSLMEVLLALTILVISIAAVSRLVDVGSERAIDSRALTRGTRLAQSKMAEVEAGIVELGSETTGNFDGTDENWEYTVSPESTGPPNLYTVTVRVKCVFQGRPAEVVLTQLVFDPAQTGSTAQAERPAPPETTDPAAGGTTP